MKDVMLDLETLDTGTNAIIIQIGACYFDRNTGKIGDTISLNIDPFDSISKGFNINKNTYNWWCKQEPDAIKSILTDSIRVEHAINRVNSFLNVEKVSIWSHATFDFVILMNHFNKLGISPTFSYRSARDIRTLTDLAELTDFSIYHNVGIAHNALDDCIYQVSYVVDCLNKLKK